MKHSCDFSELTSVVSLEIPFCFFSDLALRRKVVRRFSNGQVDSCLPSTSCVKFLTLIVSLSSTLLQPPPPPLFSFWVASFLNLSSWVRSWETFVPWLFAYLSCMALYTIRLASFLDESSTIIVLFLSFLKVPHRTTPLTSKSLRPKLDAIAPTLSILFSSGRILCHVSFLLCRKLWQSSSPCPGVSLAFDCYFRSVGRLCGDGAHLQLRFV